MRRSRRQAREAALRALYEMEIGRVRLPDALREMRANSELPDQLQEFADKLVSGVHDNQAFLDDRLSARVQEYDLDRIAAIDRNLLRIAAYELFFCDEVPPAATINEAIELAKKYSTAESGRFVNGVLGKLVLDSPKVDWDPTAHIQDIEESIPPQPEPALETVEEGTPEAKELARARPWKLRSDEERS